jgi:hypothetical protein
MDHIRIGPRQAGWPGLEFKVERTLETFMRKMNHALVAAYPQGHHKENALVFKAWLFTLPLPPAPYLYIYIYFLS